MKHTMKIQGRLIWTGLILFVGIIGLAGCAAEATGGAAAGATYAYVSGWLGDKTASAKIQKAIEMAL